MSAPVQPVVHTPGPWNLLCSEVRGGPRCLVVCPKDNEIASINPFRESWNEDPEMIEAARIHSEAKSIICHFLESGYSHPSMTHSDHEHNAAAIIARLAHANLLIERYDAENEALDKYSDLVAKLTILADRLGGEAGEEIRKVLGV